jgi:hypothetical protein
MPWLLHSPLLKGLMMKRVTTALVLGTLMATAMAAQAKDAPLSAYLWKNRVLVVVAPGRQDDNLAAQRRIFAQSAKGMAERQIVLIEAAGDDSRSRAIRDKLSLGDSAFRVVLVGKDGNAAVSSGKPLSAEELFGKVDAMPMRRDEMRR